MFEKSLSDLVRGIRAHKGQEAQYVSQCMTEIKKELKLENSSVKAMAVSKLTYLQMMGYDISWAAFNIIEVMSSTKFTYKRIGYLAATQCFHEGLDVVMLTTNLIRKDLSSASPYDASLSLNGLACFMTPDLARDLANDVLTLSASSRPFIRKKAVLTLYKVFLKFPDALRPAFPRLRDRLEDPENGVQCAAVSVICELARKHPKNYLSLAPTFFKLMSNSTNNWMLIKIIKLFGALTPLEPRLGKKLIEPLTNLIRSTSAMSLLYECISTVIAGLSHHTPSVQLCVSKLRLFMEDADQNLKYLGLLAMAKIMQKHPKAVLSLKDLILECLDDKDESLRFRALELISGMVTKKNMVEIVRKLLEHMDLSESAVYRDQVLSKIIEICSHNNYHYITNFEWYITILVEMVRFDGTHKGKVMASQMLDVTIRVRDVRQFSVKQMSNILENSHLFASGSGDKDGICEVLYAAAWIVGEFSEHLVNPRATLDSLLNPKITMLPAHIQAVFVQNIVKLYASILVKAEAEGNLETVEEVGAMLVEKLPVFLQSADLEVQERACCILQLMKYIVKLQSKGAAVADELVCLFEGELNPVAPKAQRKVPVPDGLDLDKWINEPPPESSDEGEKFAGDDIFFSSKSSGSHRSLGKRKDGGDYSPKKSKKELREEKEEMKRAREQRKQAQMNNPHYLKFPSGSPQSHKASGEALSSAPASASGIPVKKLDLGVALVIDDISPDSKKDQKGKKGRGKKGRGKRRKKGGGEGSEEDEGEGEGGGGGGGGAAAASSSSSKPRVAILEEEMPEGAVSTDEEGAQKGTEGVDTGGDTFSKLDVNLDVPLRDDEVLPVRQHRQVKTTDTPSKEGGEGEEKPKSKKKGKGKKKKGKKVVEEEEGGELGEEAKEEEGEGEGEGEGEEVKAKGRDRHKKKRSKKSSKAEAGASGKGSLVELAPEGGEEEEEGQPSTAAAAAVMETVDDDIDATMPPETTSGDKKKKKKTKQQQQQQTVTSSSTAATAADDKDLDDLDFWLNTDTSTTTSNAAAVTKATTAEGGRGGGKALSTGDGASSSKDASPSVKKKEKEKGTPESKHKKGKGEKASKKSGGKRRSRTTKGDQRDEEKQDAPPPTAAEELLDFDLNTSTPVPPPSLFKDLAEDGNLKMTYMVRANPLHNGQVTVAVVFSNKSPDQLVSLDFNVLDSLSTKLERPMGVSPHDGVPIPFQLPPGATNECQFTFYVQSIIQPQRMRGTTTYMIKSEKGTLSDKVDFKIFLPCSSYICPVPCAQQEFASLLSGGSLCETQTIKVPLTKTPNFSLALEAISAGLHLVVVEKMEGSASLHGTSISNHHICLLVKAMAGQEQQLLLVNAKGSDTALVSNLLGEVRDLV